MFSIKFDERRNLLMIEFRSNFDEHQGKLLCKRLEKELQKAKKGFMVLTDVSLLNFFDEECYQYIKEVMMICNAHGVSKIFRVIPDAAKDMGFSIMSIFHYADNVKIYTYKTLEEANCNIRLHTHITLFDKAFTILKIFKIRAMALSEHAYFRLFIIIAGFIALIILRQVFKAFGVSLGYLYITLIALSGFWFEMEGGVMAALISTLIFSVEVNIFSEWSAREIVLKTMLLRFYIYFLSGIVIGYQSHSEKQLRKKLEFLAVHDELTGLLNYRFSLELLKREFERSRRYDKNLTLAILDVDHFKVINDSHGHLVGNDSLKTFANIVKSTLRKIDVAGRYGGDEFILIFPESGADQGVKILNRIKAILSETKITSSFLMSKNYISVTFSAGLASLTKNIITINDLINSADRALYQAKEQGRDKICSAVE